MNNTLVKELNRYINNVYYENRVDSTEYDQVFKSISGRIDKFCLEFKDKDPISCDVIQLEIIEFRTGFHEGYKYALTMLGMNNEKAPL